MIAFVLHRILAFASLGSAIAALPWLAMFLCLFLLAEGDRWVYYALMLSWTLGLAAGSLSRPDRPFMLALLVYTLMLMLSYALAGGSEQMTRVMLMLLLWLAWSPLQAAARHTILLVYPALGALFWLAWVETQIVGVLRAEIETNPIFLGQGACIFGILALFYGWGRGHGWRWLGALGAAVAMAVILMTQTKGVLLALPLIWLIFVVYLRRTGALSWAALLACLVVPLAIAVLLKGSYWHRLHADTLNFLHFWQQGDNTAALDNPSISLRVELWKSAWLTFLEYPWTGVGDSGIDAQRLQHLQAGLVSDTIQMMPGTHAHNQYLEDMSLRGLPGLLALMGVFVTALLWYGVYARLQTWAAYAAVTITLSVMIFSLTEVTLRHPIKLLVYCLSLILLGQFKAGPGALRRHEGTR